MSDVTFYEMILAGGQNIRPPGEAKEPSTERVLLAAAYPHLCCGARPPSVQKIPRKSSYIILHWACEGKKRNMFTQVQGKENGNYN